MKESTVQELRAKLRGELITPTDLTYETTRKVYNLSRSQTSFAGAPDH